MVESYHDHLRSSHDHFRDSCRKQHSRFIDLHLSTSILGYVVKTSLSPKETSWYVIVMFRHTHTLLKNQKYNYYCLSMG